MIMMMGMILLTKWSNYFNGSFEMRDSYYSSCQSLQHEFNLLILLILTEWRKILCKLILLTFINKCNN